VRGPPLLDNLSRARGPPTRHSTRLSRAQGPPNPPHGSTIRTRSKNCHHGSKKRCPAPREPNQAARSPPRFESSRCFPLVFSRRHGARRPKKSLAPSSDDVPHWGSSAMLKAPPQSAASQVLTGCHCRKRRCSTLSRTALEISKQHQTSWNTASRRTNSQVETPDHQHESRRLGVG
jgi:hypothetical protein